MTPAMWISLIQTALPGALQIVTIIRDKQTGKTIVMILDDAVQAAEETKAMIAAWYTAHPEQERPK